jgi:hypothetical protein
VKNFARRAEKFSAPPAIPAIGRLHIEEEQASCLMN